VRKFIEVVTKATGIVNYQRDEGFEFKDPGSLVDEELELVLLRTFPGNQSQQDVPTYRFKMIVEGIKGEVGRIDLRVGDTERVVMYLGHIGYRVAPKYRGNRYAFRSCRLLLPLARSHGMKTLWITCNPDNAPSRRTCELLGAQLVEIVDVPKGSAFYRAGEKQKCRYRLDL